MKRDFPAGHSDSLKSPLTIQTTARTTPARTSDFHHYARHNLDVAATVPASPEDTPAQVVSRTAKIAIMWPRRRPPTPALPWQAAAPRERPDSRLQTRPLPPRVFAERQSY